MNPDAIDNETPGQTVTSGIPLSDSTVLEDAQSILHELLGLIHDRFRLAALETRRAGESLLSMIVAGVLRLIENGNVTSSAKSLADFLDTREPSHRACG